MLNEDEGQRPGQSGWADMPLWILQRFINTVTFHDDRDPSEELHDARALKAFLTQHAGLPKNAQVTDADVRHALELREALRAILVAKTESVEADARAVSIVNKAIAEAELAPAIAADCCSASMQPRASGVTGSLGRILAPMLDAMGHESWDRLKACRRRSCMWAHYDRSKNRSRNWCSMEVCGNREKVASFRARHA